MKSRSFWQNAHLTSMQLWSSILKPRVHFEPHVPRVAHHQPMLPKTSQLWLKIAACSELQQWSFCFCSCFVLFLVRPQAPQARRLAWLRMTLDS